MSILKSIETARTAGAKDDAILNEILTQNPSKTDTFKTAILRGATATDIINEIVKQNEGRDAIQRTGIDRLLEERSKQKEEPEEQKKTTLLGKVGRFFTGSAQKLAETIGTAASVIDPKTKKLRQEAIESTQKQVDNYLEMARNEKDKDRKDKLLKAAMYLADTEDIDIFNNKEYQKTAKQVYGEALGTAVEIVGWGNVGGILKGAKTITAGKMALKGAITGGAFGGSSSAASAMQQDKSGKEILKETAKGTATGAVVGGATGYITGKMVGKKTEKELTKKLTSRMTPTEKAQAYKEGLLTERTLLKSEKYTPSKTDIEMGKVANEFGLRGESISKDIKIADKAIAKEAESLKGLLKESGAIYNKNTVKGQLNKMKVDKTADLIPAEVNVYDKMIAKFNKLVEANENKGLDGLLEVRKSFDSWATSNNPNIFSNKTGGSYRALTAVRDTINNYINTKIGDDIVKESLRNQHILYKIVDKLADKGSKGAIKLQQSIIQQGIKKIAPWAGGAAGLEIIRRAVSSGKDSKSDLFGKL